MILGCADGTVEDKPVSPGGPWEWSAVLLVTPGSCGSYLVVSGYTMADLEACCPDNEADPQPCGTTATFWLSGDATSALIEARTCSWMIVSGSHFPGPIAALTTAFVGHENPQTCVSELIEATPDNL